MTSKLRFGFVFALLLLTGCVSQDYFGNLPVSLLGGNGSGSGGSGSGSGPSCSSVLQNTTEELRILFMVDNSGSTGTTDPKHTYRVQVIQDFLQSYGSKQNFTYSFGEFATDASLYDVISKSFTSNATMPFGGASDLSNALQIYQSMNPNGYTNYGMAFSLLKSAIESDLSANGPIRDYAIVFMSDGMPTDISDPIDTNLKSIVDGILSVVQSKGSLATISTVYFGPEASIEAIDHLQVIAKEGMGQFVDTNKLNGSSLSIADTISVPGQICSGQ